MKILCYIVSRKDGQTLLVEKETSVIDLESKVNDFLAKTFIKNTKGEKHG